VSHFFCEPCGEREYITDQINAAFIFARARRVYSAVLTAAFRWFRLA
jgi:hypothetical protein